MDHCLTCEEISAQFDFANPGEYKEFIRQLIGRVSRSSLRLVTASCPLEDILNKPKWPGDILSHDFQCTACNRTFHLFADTYHGGASWKQGDKPKST